MKTAGLLALSALVTASVVSAQDYVSPPPIVGLTAAPDDDKALLNFIAPGDACTNAQVAEYSVRIADFPLENFDFTTETPVGTYAASFPGTEECLDTKQFGLELNCMTSYYVAIKVKDTSGNWSTLSNNAHFTTKECQSDPFPPELWCTGKTIPDPFEPAASAGPGGLRIEGTRVVHRSTANFQLHVPPGLDGSQCEASVFDVRGRLVQALPGFVAKTGSNELTWDARDSAGRGHAAGVYFLNVKLGSRSVRQQVIVLR